MLSEAKKEMARNLQLKVNALQGFGKLPEEQQNSDLSLFAPAFPGRVFPTALHEFVSYDPIAAATTNGFITALTGKLLKEGGVCLWVGNQRKVFPLGLKQYGLEPDRIIFIHPPRIKDSLWIIEEALKCEALTAVIGEIKDLGFTDSRRLQLAIEHSGVIGFIHRYCPRTENATASTARWKITPLPTLCHDDLPGVGHSCWDVQLLKVKNGIPGGWQVNWSDGSFMPVGSPLSIASKEDYKQNAG